MYFKLDFYYLSSQQKSISKLIFEGEKSSLLNLIFQTSCQVINKEFSIVGVFFSGLLLLFYSNRKSPEKKTLSIEKSLVINTCLWPMMVSRLYGLFLTQVTFLIFLANHILCISSSVSTGTPADLGRFFTTAKWSKWVCNTSLNFTTRLMCA